MSWERIERELKKLQEGGQSADLLRNGRSLVLYRDVPTAGAPHGFSIRVDQGAKHAVAPCGQPQGTRIEVRDLFAATPARLKFLKSDRAEARACAAR